MFFLLFAFWLILNGRWTAEIAVTGVVVCGLLYALMAAFMGYSPRVEWRIAKRTGRIVGYLFYLIGQIALSAWATIRLIWSPRLTPQPELTSFHTHLRTQAGKAVLANSITMTPGTITVDIHGDLFLIHCLDDSFDMGQGGFAMEERLMRVEGGHERG